MSLSNRTGRPLLAGIFIAGGVDQLRNPEDKVPAAANIAVDLDRVAPNAPLPSAPVDLVRLNGAVQVVAGAMLALNKLPRLASAALAGSLAATTYAGHRFWEASDPTIKNQQKTQFLKNAAMLGGLAVSVGSQGNRPSVAWHATHAIAEVADAIPTADELKDRMPRVPALAR